MNRKQNKKDIQRNFKTAYSHLNNLNSAKYLIKLMKKEILPYYLDLYRLESICRVATDGLYREKAIEFMKNRKNKSTKKYINIHAKNITSC